MSTDLNVNINYKSLSSYTLRKSKVAGILIVN